ncbi:MAG: HAD family phosphatase [Verrucomicrobiota bacterium]
MTFLFDIGRVLLDFDFESSLMRLLPPTIVDPNARLAKLLDRKDELEAGLIDPDDYIAWALSVMESPASATEFRHAWQQIFTPNKPMWDCVRRLAGRGHRLILFSNINAIHCPWLFDAYQEFSLFDGAVLSFEAGCLKPEPQIYQYAVDAHALVADTTVYIDDIAQNIATGRQFGFHCWQYDLNEHKAFEHWLASFEI